MRRSSYTNIAPANFPRASIATGWLALLLIGVLPVNDACAQNDFVSIRGVTFDPRELEFADNEAMQAIGIGPLLQVPEGINDDVPVYRILQFSSPLDRNLRQELKSTGLRLDKYISGTYIEHVALSSLRELRARNILRASPRYQPAFKLVPSLRGRNIHIEPRWQTPRRQAFEGRLFRATVLPGADVDKITGQFSFSEPERLRVLKSKNAGGPIRIVFRIDATGNDLERQIAEVARIEGIEIIEEVGEMINLNARTAGVNQSGDNTNPVVWKKDIHGDGQTIGIYDNGVANKNHCFFRDEPNEPGESHRKLIAVRIAGNDNNSSSSHATSVAGSAAGDNIDNSGNDTGRGGAWASKLVLVDRRVFYEIETSAILLYDELAAVAQKAYIHNFSWQDLALGRSSEEAYNAYAHDVDRFSWKNENHLVIAAAGQKDLPSWGAPATAKNALVVSAATSNAYAIGEGYNTAWIAGVRKPDMAVVGCDLTTSVSDSNTDGCKTAEQGCATSYAAPHAAALATLARQYFVDGWYQGEALEPTGSLLKAVLINSAVDVPGSAGFPSLEEGWGVSRLANTLLFEDSPMVLEVHDIRHISSAALKNDERAQYEVPVAEKNAHLKVTLVWADLPSDIADPGLEVNLNLRVTGPDGGSVYYGNLFGDSGESQPITDVNGASFDVINNVEQILVTTPDTGTWNIEVIRTDNAQTAASDQAQGFALVIVKGRGSRSPMPPVDLGTG